MATVAPTQAPSAATGAPTLPPYCPLYVCMLVPILTGFTFCVAVALAWRCSNHRRRVSDENDVARDGKAWQSIDVARA